MWAKDYWEAHTELEKRIRYLKRRCESHAESFASNPSDGHVSDMARLVRDLDLVLTWFHKEDDVGV